MIKRTILTTTLIMSVLPISIYAATTLEQAKETANKYVPKGSILIKAKEENNKYELKFYNETKKEKYEIDISKENNKILEYKTQLNNDSGSNNIKLEKKDAENIVLSEIPHAEIKYTQLETDDNLKEYEVYFKTHTCNGYMIINPNTGDILERKFKWHETVVQDNKDYISIDKIKQIANEKVPNGLITDIDLDNKNNTYIYEVEIFKDNYEYDLILNALTGEQISLNSHLEDWGNNKYNIKWDYDEFDYDNFLDSKLNENTLNSSKIITVDKAKKIALQKVPNGLVTKIELDEDDGKIIYEGKIYKDNIEYEFEIDAHSGKIIKWEQEYDD